MNVLYGVQATGNGHLSRAREMLHHLRQRATVDVLVSGTQASVDVGCDVKYRHRGFAFTLGTNGGVDYTRSLVSADVMRLCGDLLATSRRKYDLVISDFEPITAWSAKVSGIPSVALSHHASFLSPHTPRALPRDCIGEFALRWFAPCSVSVGFHFERYDAFIHTPIIRPRLRNAYLTKGAHVLVYLPFFGDRQLIEKLRRFDVEWRVFSNRHKGPHYAERNVRVDACEEATFTESLVTAAGVLTGAGFQTPAEALFLGKKLFVVPMRGQYEQCCNAVALSYLGAHVGLSLDAAIADGSIERWLDASSMPAVAYPDNASEVADLVIAAR